MLDINTYAGRQTVKQENDAYELYEYNTGNIIVQTNKNLPVSVDGIIFGNRGMLGVIETKCRNLTWSELEIYGTWLITNKKITVGAEASKMLGVPFFGFLYLVSEGDLAIWQITDEYGNLLFDFDVKKTRTQRTVNGGVAYRDNAFLPVYEIKQKIYHDE